MTWNDYYVTCILYAISMSYASHIFLRKATNNNSFKNFSSRSSSVSFQIRLIGSWILQFWSFSLPFLFYQNFYRFFDKPNNNTYFKILILTEAIFCYKNTTYMASYRWHYETNIILGYYCTENQDFDMIYDVLTQNKIHLLI